MKTQTPYRHFSVRFLLCVNVCALTILYLVLGCWPTVTRTEQPKARMRQDAGHNRKAMPPLAQEDEASDPPVAGSGLLSPATIISAPFGTSFQVNVSAGQNIVGDAAN